jgi:hypothetical protein
MICVAQTCLHSAIYLQQYIVVYHECASDSKLPYWIWGIVSTLTLTILLPASILQLRKALGICGLLIAQGLKKYGISYEIFEQESTDGRCRDWGMAYFWSADYLPYLLLQELVDRLHEV